MSCLHHLRDCYAKRHCLCFTHLRRTRYTLSGTCCSQALKESDNAGHLDDVGYQGGRNYSVNVPLQEGMDDESYKFVFEPIMQKVRAAPP